MLLDSREEFHRVVVSIQSDGALVARSTGGQRSSRVASLSGANALIHLPIRTEQKDRLKKGDLADAILIGELVMDI